MVYPHVVPAEPTGSDVLELWGLVMSGSSLMGFSKNAMQRELDLTAWKYHSFKGNKSSRDTDGNTLGHAAVLCQDWLSIILFILWMNDPDVPVYIKAAKDAEGRRISHVLCMGDYPLAPFLLRVFVEGLDKQKADEDEEGH